MEYIKKYKYHLIYILLLLPIAVSSISYYSSILNDDFYFKMFYIGEPVINRVVNVLYFVLFTFAAFYCYAKIVRTSENLSFRYILLVCFLFILILPITSSDIFYYIGLGWQQAKYDQNPYYQAISTISGFKDNQMFTLVYWNNIKATYGPLWLGICKALASLSFGNVLIALFVFKFLNLIVHIANCFIIYKMSNKVKTVMFYALNPLLLFEVISNVHNEVLIIFLVLLSLYLLFNNKYFGALLVVALSIGIKYFTVLLIPFYLIYIFKRQKSISKIVFYTAEIILVVALLYLPYYKDLNIFTGIIKEQGKVTQSIQFVIDRTYNNKLISSVTRYLITTIFAIVCIYSVIRLWKENSIKELNSGIFRVLIVFVFIYMSTLRTWYVLWLFPLAALMNDYTLEFYGLITLFALFANFPFMVRGNDWWGLGGAVFQIIIFPFIIQLKNLKKIKKTS